MTKQRFDNVEGNRFRHIKCPHCSGEVIVTQSTEFGLWLREQPEIDSDFGFVTSNVDYIWRNYKTGDWMLIEEKRYGGDLDYSQGQTFIFLEEHIVKDDKYHGFHKIVFENTSPEDGRMWLDDREISKVELLKFLCFGSWR